MKILIVDDEPLARDRLQRLLHELDPDCHTALAGNGREALDLIEQLQPDVILLDIRMPGMDGMETAMHLNKLDNPPAIIFTTAYDQYALDAFKSHAIDYLLKPIRQAQLLQALLAARRLNRAQLQSLESIEEHPTSHNTHVSARVQGGLRLVPIEEIRCFIAEHKYVTAYFAQGELLLEESLKQLEQRFPGRFLRIHRNALVARDCIDALEKDHAGQDRLRLRGLDKPLDVSRRHLPAVRQFIKDLARGR
jgi:two-component system response regulator AlgR